MLSRNVFRRFGSCAKSALGCRQATGRFRPSNARETARKSEPMNAEALKWRRELMTDPPCLQAVGRSCASVVRPPSPSQQDLEGQPIIFDGYDMSRILRHSSQLCATLGPRQARLACESAHIKGGCAPAVHPAR